MAPAKAFKQVFIYKIKLSDVESELLKSCRALSYQNTLLFAWSVIRACGGGGGSLLAVVPDWMSTHLKFDTVDEDYMRRRLSKTGPLDEKGQLPPMNLNENGKEIFDALKDLAEHTDNDRWPLDYPDQHARGKPKDGGTALLASGTVLTSAARFRHNPIAYGFACSGTRHAAGLGLAELLKRGRQMAQARIKAAMEAISSFGEAPGTPATYNPKSDKGGKAKGNGKGKGKGKVKGKKGKAQQEELRQAEEDLASCLDLGAVFVRSASGAIKIALPHLLPVVYEVVPESDPSVQPALPAKAGSRRVRSA